MGNTPNLELTRDEYQDIMATGRDQDLLAIALPIIENGGAVIIKDGDPPVTIEAVTTVEGLRKLLSKGK